MRETLAALRVTIMVVKVVFRFFAGRTLNGERKTDATFLRPATRSLDPSGRALRWEMQRGAARLAWRLAGCYAVVLLLVLPVLTLVSRAWGGRVFATHAVVLTLTLTAYVTLTGNVAHGWVSFRLERVLTEAGEQKLTLTKVAHPGRLDWERKHVIPVACALAMQLSVSANTPAQARKIVSVPRNFRANGGVVVNLPNTFTGADLNARKRLVSTVRERLAVRTELEAAWQLEGEHPRVVLNIPVSVPTLVSFSDMLKFYEAAGEWDFVYGVIPGGQVLSVSLTNDTPHDGVSAGSGAGKSELLKTKIMQALRKGWFVIVLDWKEESQEWCKGLPGVRYVTTVEGIHDTLVALGDEVEWRKSHRDQERTRTLVVNEEWGITAPLLTEYWELYLGSLTPEEKRAEPRRSPAVSAGMKIIFTGRSLGIFETLVAQRFSARVTNGNGDLRESFGVIHMARWKSQTQKMLAPDIKPFPKRTLTPGRWVAVIGDEAVIYQAPLVTDEEAREYAQGGIDNPASPFSVHSSGGGATGAATGKIIDGLWNELPPGAARGSAVTSENEDSLQVNLGAVDSLDARKLRDCADSLEHLGITHSILRKASERDSTFPVAVGGNQFKGYTYDFAAVLEWARRRKVNQMMKD